MSELVAIGLLGIGDHFSCDGVAHVVLGRGSYDEVRAATTGGIVKPLNEYTCDTLFLPTDTVRRIEAPRKSEKSK